MKLKYVGAGNFLPGVPGRDLTEAEAEAFGGANVLVATGLYQEEKTASKADKTAEKPAKEEGE